MSHNKRTMKKRHCGSKLREDTCIMVSVIVQLLQLVTKIKYLPVSSSSLCVLLSQTVNVPNSDILQVENKPTCPAPLVPDQLVFQSKPPSVIGKVRLAEPQANQRPYSTFDQMLGYGQLQGWGQWSLGDGGDRVVGGAHLGKHLIQPLQGTMQVNLNPAGCAGHVLAVVLCSPSLEYMKISFSIMLQDFFSCTCSSFLKLHFIWTV